MGGYQKMLPYNGQSASTMPAKVYNQLLDVAQGLDFQLTGEGTSPERSADIVFVRNSTGETVNQFGVLGLDGPIITPSSNLEEFQTRITFDGVSPVRDDHAGKFAVLLEPLVEGAVGLGVIGGAAIVQLTVDPANVGGWAEVGDGNVATLVNDFSGSAQVLWMEDNGETTQWAIVRLVGLPATPTQLVIVEINNDYLICGVFEVPVSGSTLEPQPYDPTLDASDTEQIAVAKPYELQQTPWDGKIALLNGKYIKFAYTGTGTRTAELVDSGGTPILDGFGDIQTEDQVIVPDYVLGDVIAVYQTKTGYYWDGREINWMDLNSAARAWAMVDDDTVDGGSF